MLLLAKDLTHGYHKFYSYFSNGDNTKFYNAILKYVELGVLLSTFLLRWRLVWKESS